jgi:hypothetical protein
MWLALAGGLLAIEIARWVYRISAAHETLDEIDAEIGEMRSVCRIKGGQRCGVVFDEPDWEDNPERCGVVFDEPDWEDNPE